MNTNPRITRLLRIHGRVQGVSYRAHAQREAEKLGLHGWVRNRSDGSVEALLQGAPESVDDFIRWAHQGPDAARVTMVEVTEHAESTLPPGFQVLPTL